MYESMRGKEKRLKGKLGGESGKHNISKRRTFPSVRVLGKISSPNKLNGTPEFIYVGYSM